MFKFIIILANQTHRVRIVLAYITLIIWLLIFWLYCHILKVISNWLMKRDDRTSDQTTVSKINLISLKKQKQKKQGYQINMIRKKYIKNKIQIITEQNVILWQWWHHQCVHIINTVLHLSITPFVEIDHEFNVLPI